MVGLNLLNYNIQDTIMNTNIKPPRMVNPGTENNFYRQESQFSFLEMDISMPLVEVDSTLTWESYGFGHLRDSTMVKMYVDKGYQVADEATRRIVQQGNMVEMNRTPPSEIKAQEFLEKNEPVDANIAFIPKEKPEMTVHEGEVELTPHPSELNIDWEDTRIVPYQLERGTVTFDIVQRAYIDIVYMGDPLFFPDQNFQAWA